MSSVEAPEGTDSPAAGPRDEGHGEASPGSEAPVLGSPGVASSKATRGSRVPSNASVSQEEESSGSDNESSDEDSDEGVARRMKSSVAQIVVSD